MSEQVGKQSLHFANPPYIISSASVVGTKEGEGPLGDRFDMVGEDDRFDGSTWEESESMLQKIALHTALEKAGIRPQDLRYLFAGDLGLIGKEILLDLMREKGIDLSAVHEDCGIKIFDNEKQGTGSGGSGCGCSAVTLSAYYLPMLKNGEFRRILFVPTGALLSKISFYEGQNVPGIAHAVVLESE